MGISFTSPARTSLRAKLALISDTPRPAATKHLIMPTLVSSMVICSCGVGPEMFVQQLARVAGARKNQRLLGNILHANGLKLCQGIARIHHQHHAVPENRMNFQARRFGRKRDDSHVHRSVLHLLQHLVAEIPVNADLHSRIEAMIFRENIRKHIQARRFVGSQREHAARSRGFVGHGAQGFPRMLTMRTAYSNSVSPAEVSRTDLRPRSKSFSPYSCSSWRT